MKIPQLRNLKLGNGTWLWGCLLGIVCLVGFAPGFFYAYGWTDDYTSYLHVKTGHFTWNDNIAFDSGRPLYGYLLVFVFDAVGGFDQGLRIARLIGAVGATFLAMGLFRIWVNTGVSQALAFLFAVMMVMTPAMAVYAGWAVCFPFSIAGLLALIGGWVAWMGAICTDMRPKCVRFGISFLLLFLSETIYQPAAGFFLLPGLIYSTGVPIDISLFRKWGWLFSLNTVVIGCYFALYKIVSLYWLQDSWVVRERASLTFNIADRFADLAGRLDQAGLSSWFVLWTSSDWPMIVIAGLLILFGTVSLIRTPRRILLIPVVLGCFVFMNAPIMVTSEKLLPFRVFAATQGLVMMGLCLLVLHVARSIRTKYSGATILFVLAASATMIWATHTALKYDLALPLQSESRMMRDVINREYADQLPEMLLLVLPEWWQRPDCFPMRAVSEFGFSSFVVPWTAHAFTNIYLVESGRGSYDNLPVTVIPVAQSDYYSSGGLRVIDYGSELLGVESPLRDLSEFAQRNDLVNVPSLGGSVHLYDRWYFHPHFGYFVWKKKENIIHSHLGDMSLGRLPSGHCVGKSEQLGTILFRLENFPWVYLVDEERWVYLKLTEDSYEVASGKGQ